MKPGTTRAINPHLLTGAHALGALPDAERDQFEAHLGLCRGCTDEVAELRETAARLGHAAGHPAPAALRSQVLAAVRRVPQVPPAVETWPAFSRRQGFQRAAALIAAACMAAAVVAGVHGALTTSIDTPMSAVVSHSRDELLFAAHGLPALPRDRVYRLWLVDGHGPRAVGTLRQTGSAMSLRVTGIEGVREAILTVEPAGGSPSPAGSPVMTVVLT